MSFAVISFPGTNCEIESVRALKKAGIKADIIRWNEPKKVFDKYNGYLLAGGFSYEDRGRSGVVAANDNALDYLREASKQGKLIIGICNGAQILVESGLVTDSITPKIALTINKRVKNQEVQGIGYYHDWCYLKNIAKKGRSPFNNFNELIKLPIAHGEGRFVIRDDVFKEMKNNDQIVFLYTDKNGNLITEYPINPNGSYENIAGVCNKTGNVLAMMPHPERSTVFAEVLFKGLKKWLDNNKNLKKNNEPIVDGFQISIKEKQNYKLEFFIKTIITDNNAETIRNAISRKLNKDITLERMRYFGIDLEGDTKDEAEKIIKTDELANTNKEIVYARIHNEFYRYQKNKGFIKYKDNILSKNLCLYICDNEDIISKAKIPRLKHENIVISKMESAICWLIEEKDEKDILKTGILANPVSMHVIKQ